MRGTPAHQFAGDVTRHYGDRDVLLRRLRALANPSLRAVGLVRLAAGPRRLVSWRARRRLIRNYGIDVGYGARLGSELSLPHPTGIVIGAGVRVADRVTLYHHVTLGRGRGGYPNVGSDVTILPGAVVVGGVRVGRGALIGANAFVATDVPDGAVVRGGERCV